MSLLRQTEYWVNQQGEIVLLKHIDPRYATNIVILMERNAPEWKRAVDMWYVTTPGPSGDMASMVFDEECNRQWDMSPQEWLSKRPLYRAIRDIALSEIIDW
jgi:hypothetical protein